jgi:hypothetical protein
MNNVKLCALPAIVLFVLTLTPFSTAQAQVAVTSADPSSAPQGTLSLDVTVNCSGFDSSAKASALMRAQLELRSDEKYSHPYFWPPFILVARSTSATGAEKAT